jgi:hypothetical protein
VEWTATDAVRLGRHTDGERAGDVDGTRGPGRGLLHLDGVEVPFDAGLDGYPDVE